MTSSAVWIPARIIWAQAPSHPISGRTISYPDQKVFIVGIDSRFISVLFGNRQLEKATNSSKPLRWNGATLRKFMSFRHWLWLKSYIKVLVIKVR